MLKVCVGILWGKELKHVVISVADLAHEAVIEFYLILKTYNYFPSRYSRVPNKRAARLFDFDRFFLPTCSY